MGFRNLDATDLRPFIFGYYVAGFHLSLHTGKHGKQLHIWMKPDPLSLLKMVYLFSLFSRNSSKVLVRERVALLGKVTQNEEVSHSVPGTFFFFSFLSLTQTEVSVRWISVSGTWSRTEMKLEAGSEIVSSYWMETRLCRVRRHDRNSFS